ncbi:MAG: PH domain-containing protein [Oscillochloridaceae bacterium umkhey_bin13]
MHSDTTVWFASKLDWWLCIVLVALPIMQIGFLGLALRDADGIAVVANLIGLGFIGAIYGLLVIPVRYGITSDALLVHFGVVRQRIRFEAILEVYPSRSPLSSPALSLDRLAIRTGRGPMHFTLISPRDRDTFIQLLTSRAGLIWDGRRWVRNPATPPV